MADTLGITLSIDGGRERSGAALVAQPQLVLVIECSRPSALPARYSLAGLTSARLGRGRDRSATRGAGEGGPELALTVPDRWMSSKHARLEHSFGRWILHDEGSKNGSLVNGTAVGRAVLGDGDLIELGHTVFRYRDRVPMSDGDPPDLDFERQPPSERGMATLVPALARELAKLRQVAASEIPILLQGESGTGKEVLARAVHRLSGRSGEMIPVNCGAIPPNLVESELFGHKKGAFSGATDDRPGLVRAADRGTLLLDEIGDLPASSQAALLRVLQEREVMPVGGTRPVPVDLRVVAATHRDLDDLVASGRFRHDLMARLAGFRMTAPPLRERLDDLGLLVATLLGAGSGETTFEPEAVRLLLAYPWPLNIRELAQSLQTAAVLAAGAPIGAEHLPESVRLGRAPASITGSGGDLRLSEADLRLRDEVASLLATHAGNVSAVARAMGKDRKQIQRWIKRFALDTDQYR